MSEKIGPQHLSRKAMLYVRQSSAFQVSHNLESGKLQYAMQARLRDLGFAEIEVVDEDLGRSAAGTVTRSGFERMVAEVSLGRVGAVAAREVSRFARNSRELAATGRGLPHRRHCAHRSRDGLRPASEQ
jgi:DNA invertase Pin-like site-specific DNA recombinase